MRQSPLIEIRGSVIFWIAHQIVKNYQKFTFRGSKSFVQGSKSESTYLSNILAT